MQAEPPQHTLSVFHSLLTPSYILPGAWLKCLYFLLNIHPYLCHLQLTTCNYEENNAAVAPDESRASPSPFTVASELAAEVETSVQSVGPTAVQPGRLVAA